MRCLNCQYDLSKLTECRCPECGRQFDPKNPATIDSRSLKARQLVLFTHGLVVVLWLFATMIWTMMVINVVRFHGWESGWKLAILIPVLAGTTVINYVRYRRKFGC